MASSLPEAVQLGLLERAETQLAWCSKCKTEKPRSDFHRRRRNASGLAEWCKECCARRAHAYQKANPAKTMAARRKWYAENPDRVSKIYRRHNLKRQFGLTVEQYDEMATAQGGLCAICRRANGQFNLAVDHDHETGTIRGLLCHNCNQALGKFQDSPALLRKAAAYLEGSGASLAQG